MSTYNALILPCERRFLVIKIIGHSQCIGGLFVYHHTILRYNQGVCLVQLFYKWRRHEHFVTPVPFTRFVSIVTIRHLHSVNDTVFSLIRN